MRADAIERVDGAEPAMPGLAALAARSTHFVDASASAAWTAPSVSTLLTGQLPVNHGNHGNVGSFDKVPAAAATLAEYLRSAGYATAACVGGGFVSEDTGLHQGFDSFEKQWTLADASGALERWIRERDPAKPSFLFLHTYDAHDPYGDKPPRPTRDDVEKARAFVDSLRPARQETKRFPPDRMREVVVAYRSDPLASFLLVDAFTRASVVGEVIAYDREVFPTAPDRAETAALLRDRYRAGLRTTDDALQRVLARLDQAGLDRNTILVVVTDHGEAFGEHENLGHGRWLYDELVRAILLVRAPGRLDAPRLVRGSCGLVDVVPTLLDLVGLPPPSGIDGRSLLPLASGRTKGHAVLADEHHFRRDPEGRVPTRLFSARTERAKWLGTWDAKTRDFREVLFDLERDPAERRPLSADDVPSFGAELAEGVARAREFARAFQRAPALPHHDDGEADR